MELKVCGTNMPLLVAPFRPFKSPSASVKFIKPIISIIPSGGS